MAQRTFLVQETPGMTAPELRAALGRVGESQRGFARLVGVDERTVRRWVAGAAEVPLWVPLLLGLMEASRHHARARAVSVAGGV
jgi:DNA-binding transcriptional regulator YiaG